jgi:ATP-dependent Clp protease ATP-binding subunit ClpA
MTSNVGSDHIAKMSSLGFLAEKDAGERKNLQEKVMEALREEFKPEFLNRIDEIIIFDYLGKPEIKKIVDLELEKVASRLTNKNIEISVTEKAKQLLAERGFDPNLGARPLKRVIQKLVLDPLALQIVTGKISERVKVLVDAEGDKIIFRTHGSLVGSRVNKDKEKIAV